MNKGSIFQKIQRQTLFGLTVAVVAVCLAAVVCIAVMRSRVMYISEHLGNSAANDSKAALALQAEELLVQLARNKATISDEKLAMAARMVTVIAENATAVVSDPGGYSPKTVRFPSAANAGRTVAQLRLPEGVSYESMEEEIGLLGNLSVLLASEYDTLDYVASVYVGSQRGVSISADKDSDKKTYIYDPRQRSWYIEALEAGGLTWTDIFVDNSGRGLGITCAMPFYGVDGRIEGVAGVGMLLEVLKQIVVETRLGETGYAFISNERGEMIISDTTSINQEGAIVSQNLFDLLPQETAERMQKGGSGIERVNVDGTDCFIAYEPLQTLPWSLAVVMSVAEVIAPAIENEGHIIAMTNNAVAGIDRMILFALGIFAAALLLTFVGSALLARRMAAGLAEPIIALSNGASIIGSGNLEHRLDIKTGDELEALGNAFNIMIDNIKTITADKERIGAELNVATRIQASMLPNIFPPFPDRAEFDIYATMQPAKEVGGDFYDFFLIDDKTLAVVIADVSGKGVPAALFMVIAKTLIKNNAQYGKSPKEVFESVNNILCENNEADMFVTAFMGYLDIPSGKFTYVNAGHNPPAWYSNGRFDWLPTKPGFVLAGMEDLPYKQDEIQFNAGDRLYLYTDGVTEAMDVESRLFTEARLLNVLNTNREQSPKELLACVKGEIDAFAHGTKQADDITMLVLHYKKTDANRP